MEVRRTTESDPHDTWAPILLPTDKFYQLNTPLRSIIHLTQAIDSLGYSLTSYWPTTLKVAEAISQGVDVAGSSGAIARYARIPRKNVFTHIDDLHKLFGENASETTIIDHLFKKQFLSFQTKPHRMQGTEGLDVLLEASIQDANTVTTRERDQLFRKLNCQPTLPAAVRRAYELGIRKPHGIPGGRFIGFLFPNIECPAQYPPSPRPLSIEKEAWEVTKKALRGYPEPSTNPAVAIEIEPRLLAFACLVAVGCGYRDISNRLALKPATIKAGMGTLASYFPRGNKIGRVAATEWLFKNDIFFAVPHLATNGANDHINAQ